MLTYRAVFNALAGFLDHATRIVVGFVITPILLANMGSTMFGIWQVIFRLYSQLAPLDGRSAELLKWQLANLQNDNDEARKKQIVGASLLSFMTYIPLLVLAYLICIFYFTDFIDAEPLLHTDIKLTFLILCLNTLLIALSLHSEAVLRGSNLFYKVMGLKPLILIVSGVITALAVYLGYGIVGAAVGQLVIGFISVPLLYLAMKRFQPWFAVKIPALKDYYSFLKRCKWFVTWEILSVWMIAGEIVILGWLSTADNVTIYTLSMYAMQILAVVVLTTVSSAMPGMGGLIGNNEYKKVSNIRKESLYYSGLLSVVICSILIMFNESFVTLWVGKEYFSGYLENILISICALQMIFIKHDAFMLNMALDIKPKVLLGFASFIMTFILMYLLIPKYEILGLCFSLILGRGVLTITYPMIIRKYLKNTKVFDLPIRLLFVSLLILVFVSIISKGYIVSTWFDLFWQATVITIILLTTTFYLSFNREMKVSAYNRINQIRIKNKHNE